MALIPPVADQPTALGKLQALWDFTTVKLVVIAGILGAIGISVPAGQKLFGPDFMAWMSLWIVHLCQTCGLLVTIGIIPARVTVQPNLLVKQAQRAAANSVTVNPQPPPSGG